MIINSDTPLYIYGYGTRGRTVYEELMSYQLNVKAYIDRNAIKYKNSDTNIYTLDEICELIPNIKDSVVFVTITNVFTHAAIVEELYKKGFRYIVYKELKNNSYARQINLLYESVLNVIQPSNIEGKNIPQYRRCKENRHTKNSEEIVVCNVPINLLFGLTKELLYNSLLDKKEHLLKALPDKSILYYTVAKGMMNYFEKPLRVEDWDRQRKLFFECRDAQISESDTSVSTEEQNENLKDRYSIFSNMDELFSENPLFFWDNPISVVWNQKGYFNIEDGNNRAIFLLGKGVRSIPCRMRKDDYFAWMNDKEKITQLENFLEKKKITLRAPIAHPLFVKYPVALKTYSYLKLQHICEYMWLNDINPMGKYILDIDTENDLCGQHMARMGGHLINVNSADWLEISKFINDLLYIKDVLYAEKIDDLARKQYEIIFCNSFTEDNVKQMCKIDFVYLFGEFIDIEKHEIDVISDKLLCKKYDIVREQLVADKVYTIVCFKG